MFWWISTNIQEDSWQTCHNYEQKLGDIKGLTEQENFPLAFPKNWLSLFCVKSFICYN